MNIGRTPLIAALAVLVAVSGAALADMATYGGFWLDKDNTTRIPGMICQPASGLFPETAVTTTVATSSTLILNAAPRGRRIALVIEVNTSGSTITCTDDGSTPVLWTAPGLSVSGQGASLNYQGLGWVPNGTIKCIGSQSTAITVRAG